jgi:uncharacterized membrane protein
VSDIIEGKFSEKTREDLQKKVKSLLRVGIFFSIFWIAGMGSIISIVLGSIAKNIIKRVDNINGINGVYWCLIVGWLGLIISILIFIAIIFPVLFKKY